MRRAFGGAVPPALRRANQLMATGQYAAPVIRKLVDSGLPVFGID